MYLMEIYRFFCRLNIFPSSIWVKRKENWMLLHGQAKTSSPDVKKQNKKTFPLWKIRSSICGPWHGNVAYSAVVRTQVGPFHPMYSFLSGPASPYGWQYDVPRCSTSPSCRIFTSLELGFCEGWTCRRPALLHPGLTRPILWTSEWTQRMMFYTYRLVK